MQKAHPLRLRSILLHTLLLCIGASGVCITTASRSLSEGVARPTWLDPHVGDGPEQIAPVVLDRARALYMRKYNEGTVRNSCYFAMDATRPNDRSGNDGRFYMICEAERFFRAISAGHGGGRHLQGMMDFSNGMTCAKNFSNALDSELTAGGSYLTAETKTSFKGYYLGANGQAVAFSRTFLQFDGEGDAATARARAIGGHAAVTLKGVCRRKDASSPYADQAGYVPFGRIVDYAGGRSNGCTSWSAADAAQILTVARDNPTTLYIYPEQADIKTISRAVAAGQPLVRAGVYWNKACLKTIHAPRFWPREELEPLLMRYRQAHPAPPPQPTPLCREQ